MGDSIVWVTGTQVVLHPHHQARNVILWVENMIRLIGNKKVQQSINGLKNKHTKI